MEFSLSLSLVFYRAVCFLIDAVQQMSSGFCPENLLPYDFKMLFGNPVFVDIDQKIGFDQNLVICFGDVLEGVMMPYQPADAFDLCRSIPTNLFQQFSGFGRPLLFLIFSFALAILLFGDVNADVVYDGS